MALIGKIRRNSWLLIILIGLGLGGFIIMDMFNSQTGSFGSGSQTTMGVINGEKIDYNHFSRVEQTLYQNSGVNDTYGRRDYLWNYFVEEALVKDEAEELGLGVSRDELRELQFGATVSPIIQARFTDQTTGQVDRAQLNNIQKALDSGELAKSPLGPFWQLQEKEVIKDRLQSKLNNMVSKALFMPSYMIERTHFDQNNKIDVNFVQIPFDEVSDLDIKIEEGDLQSYLSKNKSTYIQDEEVRRMVFTSFKVLPTAQDSAKLLEDMTALATEFKNTDNDTAFVENNYGTINAAYSKRSQLNPDIVDAIFDAELGSVYGPYQEGNAYKLAKVVDRKTIPDSVRSRHILIPAKTQQDLAAAFSRVDSLKNLLEAGTHSFDSLALAFGTDGTRTKGGDLGFAAQGTMVKPFNDLIFYQAKEGELNPVITQFGVHLVEVTGRKFITNESSVRVAYVSQNIIPSEATQKKMNNEALEFVAANRTVEDLIKSIEADDRLELTSPDPLKKNDFNILNLGFDEECRRIVRWLYSSDAEKGKVSPSVYVFQDAVDYYESQYVIAGLKSIQPAGNVTLNDVRDDIEPLVRKQKKGEAIASKISSKDLSSIASQFSTKVDTFNDMYFGIRARVELGSEPKIVAKAFEMDKGAVSEPIVGDQGVYVIQVADKRELPVPSNMAQMRTVQSISLRSQVQPNLLKAIKKESEIVDNRSRFY